MRRRIREVTQYLIWGLMVLTFLSISIGFPSSANAAANSLVGEESENLMIWGIAATLLSIGAGAIRQASCGDSIECSKMETNGKFGLCFPIDGQFKVGPGVGAEVYRRHIRHLGSLMLGLGFSCRQHRISSQWRPESGLYYSDIVEARNIFVGNLYLNLVVPGKGNSYVGLGVGFFIAESDRVTPLSKGDAVGDGLSYQVFFGMKSKPKSWKGKFFAEVKYELMKPQKESSHRPKSKDFGGFSLLLGLAF